MTTADATIAFVGFGEAGRAFARGFGLPEGRASAFDINPDDSMREAAAHCLVRLSRDPATALAGGQIVFALVPTDQTLAAASACAAACAPGAMWLDGSSSSPGRKRAAAGVVDAAGAHYVDLAIMAPVHPRLHRTPVLVSGPHADQAMSALLALGMAVEFAGHDVGGAAAVKMIRSVLVKGIEAVTAECFLAARRAGVEDAVLASFRRSDPAVDWAERSAYNLERMARHGNRRAAELREVVTTLAELGVPAQMSAATAGWQDLVGDLGLALDDLPLAERLDAVLEGLG